MLPKRKLGPAGPGVAVLGLSCMGMCEFYGPADDAESIATIHRACAKNVVAIPGAKTQALQEENLAAADLPIDAAEKQRLDKFFPLGATAGLLYPKEAMIHLNI